MSDYIISIPFVLASLSDAGQTHLDIPDPGRHGLPPRDTLSPKKSNRVPFRRELPPIPLPLAFARSRGLSISAEEPRSFSNPIFATHDPPTPPRPVCKGFGVNVQMRLP